MMDDHNKKDLADLAVGDGRNSMLEGSGLGEGDDVPPIERLMKRASFREIFDSIIPTEKGASPRKGLRKVSNAGALSASSLSQSGPTAVPYSGTHTDHTDLSNMQANNLLGGAHGPIIPIHPHSLSPVQLQALALQQNLQPTMPIGLLHPQYTVNASLLAQTQGVLPKPTGSGSANGVQSGSMQGKLTLSNTQDDALAKKSRRLIKNRVAAKECRRKKKEYIRDLEQKLELVEQSNKQLMEENEELKKRLAAAQNHL